MKGIFQRAVGNFKRGEKGYTTVIIAIILPIFIGLISFGVDWSYSSSVKTRYSTIGIEALSTKPIHKNTPAMDIIDWLRQEYDQKGFKYSDIEVTESNNGQEFRVKVKFDYNSVFSNLNSDMAQSTFSFKHSGKFVSNSWCDWTVMPDEEEKSYCDKIPFLPIILNENSFTKNAYRYQNAYAEGRNELTHEYKLTTNKYNALRKARGKIWKLNTNQDNATISASNDLRTLTNIRILETPALRSGSSTATIVRDVEAFAVINTQVDNNSWTTMSDNYTTSTGTFKQDVLKSRLPYVQNAIGKIRPIPENGYGTDANGTGVADTEWQKAGEYDVKVLFQSNTTGNNNTYSTASSANGFFVRVNNNIVTSDANLNRTARSIPRGLRARATEVYNTEANYVSGGVNTACTDLENALKNTSFADDENITEYLKVITQEMMYCNLIFGVHAGYAFPVTAQFNTSSSSNPPIAARINSLRYIFVPRQSALGSPFPLETTSDFEYYNIDPIVKYYAKL